MTCNDKQGLMGRTGNKIIHVEKLSALNALASKAPYSGKMRGMLVE